MRGLENGRVRACSGTLRLWIMESEPREQVRAEREAEGVPLPRFGKGVDEALQECTLL